MTKTLTDKQRRFAEEYVVDFNGKQAAIRAGYSPRSAKVTAARLLTNANLQSLIREKVEKHAERAEITTDRIFEEYGRLAFSDLRDVVSWSRFGVALKDSGALSEEAAATVREVTESVTDREDGGTTVRRTVKLHDKLGALRDLAKIMGMFPKDGAAVTGIIVYLVPNVGK